MKRAGNLFNQIANIDNLYLAFYKAKRGKEAKPEIIDYSKNLQFNLIALNQSLLNGYLHFGDYHFFTIYEPKKRLICAAPFADRVVHHAIMNVCHYYFEQFQISDSYASRLGKGQYEALNRAFSFNSSLQWFCKLDIRKYFDSIDHAILFQFLMRKFKDPKLLDLYE